MHTVFMFCLFPEPSLAFSHSPGCMFLTDIPDSSSSSQTPSPSDSVNPSITDPSPELIPLCFLVSHNPLLYSLASQRAVAKIRHLETIIGEDPGKHVQSDVKCCLSFTSLNFYFSSETLSCYLCFFHCSKANGVALGLAVLFSPQHWIRLKYPKNCCNNNVCTTTMCILVYVYVIIK